LLKFFKNGIVINIEKKKSRWPRHQGGEMKIPVLKALANPAHIFFVPYNLAVFNFMVHLMLYVVLFFGGLIISAGRIVVNPLYFAISLIAVHMILAGMSKKEPFILRIFMARFKLFRMRVPKELWS